MLSDCGMDYYDYIILVQGLNGYGNFGVGSDLEAYVMARLDAGGNVLMTSVDYIYGIIIIQFWKVFPSIINKSNTCRITGIIHFLRHTTI